MWCYRNNKRIRQAGEKKVDEEDGKHADNEVDYQKILDMCSPYVW